MNESEPLYLMSQSGSHKGSILRGHAHGDPSKTHLEVGVLLIADDGRVLLSQRSEQKERNPGVWELSCSGHVTHGETPANAAIAEMEEELGLKDITIKKVGRSFFKNDYESHYTVLFTARYSGEELVLQEEEMAASHLFNCHEALELGEMLHPEFAPFIFMALSGQLPRHFEYRVY